jgi:hypothetical protein
MERAKRAETLMDIVPCAVSALGAAVFVQREPVGAVVVMSDQMDPQKSGTEMQYA